MSAWRGQDAKVRFGEFLNAALKVGPQVVTSRGIEVAVLVSMEEWRRLKGNSVKNIKELLLQDESRFENVAPRMGKWKRRPALDFSRPAFKRGSTSAE